MTSIVSSLLLALVLSTQVFFHRLTVYREMPRSTRFGLGGKEWWKIFIRLERNYGSLLSLMDGDTPTMLDEIVQVKNNRPLSVFSLINVHIPLLNIYGPVYEQINVDVGTQRESWLEE